MYGNVWVPVDLPRRPITVKRKTHQWIIGLMANIVHDWHSNWWLCIIAGIVVHHHSFSLCILVYPKHSKIGWIHFHTFRLRRISEKTVHEEKKKRRKEEKKQLRKIECEIQIVMYRIEISRTKCQAHLSTMKWAWAHFKFYSKFRLNYSICYFCISIDFCRNHQR